MNIDLKFSHWTLFFYFALPFAYYAYTGKFWNKPKKLKLCSAILVVASVTCGALAIAQLIRALRAGEMALLELSALHIAPPLLAIMAYLRGRNSIAVPHMLAQALGPSKESADPSFQPKPLNDEVERISWDDLIISGALKKELMSVVQLLRDPQTAHNYGIAVPKGILLSGPPGTGKTTIAKAIASSAGLSFFALQANEIVSKWVGESERNLSALFEAARKHAPAVIFIDEIDALGKKRSDKNAAHQDNLVNHLLQLMDGVVKVEGLYIVAATNRPELVDDALKRAGRLNRVIEIGLPDHDARRQLFTLYLGSLKLAADVDAELLARVTEGNSAADIKEICNQAGFLAYQRESDQVGPSGKRTFLVASKDIEQALEQFQLDDDELQELKEHESGGAPMPQNANIEQLSWDDVIIDQNIRADLDSVIELLRKPETATRYGIDVPKGILLSGPPGTGKTTIAKIIANTAGLSFFVLQADEIVSKWVGESEKNLSRLFKAAQKHAPSVIFIDEVDSIGKQRAEGNAQHSDNLLNHLLQLIDGVVKTEGLYVIAATNRADLIDSALKRGGRLNRTIEIPLPSRETRRRLFQLYLDRMAVADEVDLDTLAESTAGKSPADIRAICNQAGLHAFRRESSNGKREYVVRNTDLRNALVEFKAAA